MGLPEGEAWMLVLQWLVEEPWLKCFIYYQDDLFSETQGGKPKGAKGVAGRLSSLTYSVDLGSNPTAC